MSFTQPCFIRGNTHYLRKRLEFLGYKPFMNNRFRLPYLSTHLDGIYFQTDANRDGGLECFNEDLFIAIAALRDDNDYMQWFITEADQPWVDCPIGSFILCTTEYRYPKEWIGNADFSSLIVSAHKATVEELIEHFK